MTGDAIENAVENAADSVASLADSETELNTAQAAAVAVATAEAAAALANTQAATAEVEAAAEINETQREITELWQTLQNRVNLTESQMEAVTQQIAGLAIAQQSTLEMLESLIQQQPPQNLAEEANPQDSLSPSEAAPQEAPNNPSPPQLEAENPLETIVENLNQQLAPRWV